MCVRVRACVFMLQFVVWCDVWYVMWCDVICLLLNNILFVRCCAPECQNNLVLEMLHFIDWGRHNIKKYVKASTNMVNVHTIINTPRRQTRRHNPLCHNVKKWVVTTKTTSWCRRHGMASNNISRCQNVRHYIQKYITRCVLCTSWRHDYDITSNSTSSSTKLHIQVNKYVTCAKVISRQQRHVMVSINK